MIGNHDAVNAVFARQYGVGFGEDALDHQLAFPQPAHQRHVLPVEMIAPRALAHRGARHQRRARPHVLEMRHALRKISAQRGADQPARSREALQREPQIRPQRRVITIAYIIFTVCTHRNIDRQHQRFITGARHALDQLGNFFCVAGQISLEPGVTAAGFAYFFQRRQRRAAQNHRHVFRGRRQRQRQIALKRRERSAAHRCDAERAVVGLAEQRGFGRAARDVDQHARHQRDVVEHRTVPVERHIALDAARHVTENRPRDVASRGRLEILQRQHHAQRARRGGAGEVRCGAVGGGQRFGQLRIKGGHGVSRGKIEAAERR